MSDLICDVISKSRVLYSGNLSLIVVPGEEGDMGFMENHEPYIISLRDGVVRGRTHSGKLITAAVMGGYAQILGRRVIIICDKARSLPSIDYDEVSKAYNEVAKSLEELEMHENKEGNYAVTHSLLTRRLRWLKVQKEAKEKESFYIN
ncbi:MAG: ATP synthase F1 subunit epsilon [Anaerotardibacter sp.]